MRNEAVSTILRSRFVANPTKLTTPAPIHNRSPEDFRMRLRSRTAIHVVRKTGTNTTSRSRLLPELPRVRDRDESQRKRGLAYRIHQDSS